MKIHDVYIEESFLDNNDENIWYFTSQYPDGGCTKKARLIIEDENEKSLDKSNFVKECMQAGLSAKAAVKLGKRIFNSEEIYG